ncbi:helix-turn-helix domain-containing protein [Fodinibius salsisoli]|uniref:AraC family transcriptional regulator n=1 Tax=Fodinibius salsisoli TaxID=2820877 RepID=A0ABT3PKJ6_9BACT|nr:helix-turn-helix domain-containing protein [Fodinibius salsisoli]MCW9706390.1 AraC family transcriptional regulator [Fodinibius salsisoli]
MEIKKLTNSEDINIDHIHLKGFKVYEVGSDIDGLPFYGRKDFYKICLHNGNSIIRYADKEIEINATTLFFGTPHTPYSWEVISATGNSYACLFSEEFLKNRSHPKSLEQSPLFDVEASPVYSLNEEQATSITDLFQKMLAEQNQTYHYKNEVIRSYVNLIIHESLKMQPSGSLSNHHNAASRITSLFLELLERQFPIESPHHPLQLNAPTDYAEKLNVHVNHLNRSVKEVTGQSTSKHISERIIVEAKALLKHTDCNVSDIAYALGFEYSTYFSNYFKRNTGTTPTSVRQIETV